MEQIKNIEKYTVHLANKLPNNYGYTYSIVNNRYHLTAFVRHHPESIGGIPAENVHRLQPIDLLTTTKEDVFNKIEMFFNGIKN